MIIQIRQIVRHIRFLVLVFTLLVSLVAKSAVDDVFTADTEEGVPMKFKVTSETDKTCQVGQSDYFHSSVPTYTEGVVTIPSTVNGYTVTSIGGYSFIGCNNITSIIIPNTVESIDGYAFTGSFSSENLTMMTNITIPKSVKYIGHYAFSGTCIESIVIPSNVTKIQNSSFDSCSKLASIIVDENNATYDSRNNCNAIIESASNKLIAGISTTKIPDDIKSIDSRAFFKITNLSNISLPSSIGSIGEYAFYGCTNLNVVISKIISPFSISNVFNGISSSAVLKVPRGTKNLYQAITGWSQSFAEIVEGEDVNSFNLNITAIGNGCVTYNSTAVRGKTTSFTVNEGSSATITFAPDNGYRVTSVKKNNTDVTSSVSNNQLTINNVKEDIDIDVVFGTLSVGDTFTAETAEGVLMTFKVTDSESMTCQVGNDTNAAIAVSTTGTVSIPTEANGYKVTAIGKKAFWNTYFYVNRFILPEGITSIGPWAFYQESSLLTTINIPSTVQSIGDRAFANCTHLSNVYITDIKSWCNITFEGVLSNPLSYAGCFYLNGNKITDLQIPEGVKKLNPNVFMYYTQLNSVTLPSSLTSIGNSSFKYCHNLSSVVSNIAHPFSIPEDVFSEISSNSILYVPFGTKEEYLSTTGWTSNFNQTQEIGACTLEITVSGNGSATYSNTTIKNQTKSFTVEEGTSATVSFSPDSGYRIKSVKLNTTDVTASVANSQYIISSISANTTLEVEFEAITHSLSITATGNGVATYNDTSVRGKTSTFTVSEGTSAIVTFTPDTGYRVKSVKVNNTDVTSAVSNGQYTISNITADASLEVEFEAIPPTTYTFTIKATGNGTVTYDGTAVRGKSSSFTVNEGTSATVSFSPDSGYRIKSVKLNNTDVTSSVSDGKYTISNITSNTTLDVEFEVITYTLSVKATGNGSATYNNTSVRGKTTTFTVNHGTSATVSFSPDSGYRIKSVKLNNADVTANVSNSQYTISSITANTTLEVEFEAIPPTTYSFTIKATGNGTVTYDGTAVRGKSSSFTVNEGTSATVSFSPDSGYRIKSVKLNNTDVTSSVSNSKYTISNITVNTTLDVEFEAIPPTTYTFTVKATGNGTVTYDGTAVRGKSSSFTVNEGTSATVLFSPDSGYRIKSVKLNNADVTANVSNSQYTISSITANTTLDVEFEAIPPTTYSFTIKATGNGTVTYDGTAVRGKSSSFTVNEGTSATVSFSPDSGYRIKSVKLNNTDVTANVSNNQYTINNITADASLEVEFEAIPPTTYSFTIKATGNGTVTYDGTAIRGKSSSFTVNEGTSATVTFTPDSGNRIKSVKLNNTDVTSSVSNGKYTISNITANTTLDVEFEVIPPTTYTFTVKATGNGTVTYDGTAVRGKSSSFTVNEGTSATVTFTPDSGNRIKSVKLNNTDVTSSVSNGKYTISNITANTTLDVEFEAIPPTTYTFTVKATGNGTVTYDGAAVRGKSSSFTVNEGTSATVSFTPDAGYRIKSVKLNNTDVTVNVSNSQYTISSITANTTLDVEFEAIPPTTYTFTVKATGNGSVTYDGTAIRGKSSSFTVNEGTSAIVTFTPDTGNRIKSVKLNNTDVTSSVSNGKYTISNITANTTLDVEFEVIPTYTLNIVATGNGNVTYNGTVVRNQSQNYSVREGSFVVVSIVPDAGYRVASAKINSTDVTGDVSEGKLSISNITSNKTIEIAFEAIPPTTYTLTVKVEGNGMVLYDGATIRNESNVFTVVEGTYATLTITPDEGNRIKSVKVNSVDNTSNVKDGKYTINSISANTVVEVVFEPLPTLTFTIKATGNGKVAYNNTDVRGKTAAFTVNHGTSATVTFTPDTGNRIKSVKLNNTDVTSGVSNGKYTISSITANTTLDVEFEVITYTLSVKATGNGSATYSNTPVRDKTTPFTVNHGTSATVTFTPDTGNRIKSVKLNNTDVTSSVSNGKYTISNITANTTLDVEFEAIPTYTLNIVATGNGNVTYNGTVVRNQSQNYSVREGSSVVVSIVPDAGYRVASAKINSTDVTGDVSEGKLSISNITSNKTIEIAFEAIPPTTYALTVKAEGNGMVLYDGATIRNESNVFTVAEGTYATLTITPDEGNRIKSVKVNSVDNTSNVTDGKYTVDKIKVNTIVEVIFEEKVNSLTVEGVSYAVISQSNKTVMVASGNYGQVLTVPATVTQNGTTWTVTAVDDNALKDDTELAAVIWNPTVPFTATVSNPNLLLYVTSDQYAPASIKNVVVNGVANSITLVDAASGNGFCCPQAFTAKSIIYNHTYNMTTGIGESRGWETIALPFDVQSIRHESKGEMIPFIQKKDGNGAKPFWLYELTGSGFVKAGSIKAYTPYIISMPHHQQYDEQWHLNGRVTFSASNVTIAKTEDLQTPSYMDRTFIPCFTDKDANEGLYVLNVNNDYSTNNSGMTEGSKFVLNMRQLHPFEAYMTTSSNAKYMIDIFEDMPNAIDEMESEGSIGDSEVFDLQGRKILAPKKGVYIKNRRKYIK